MNKEETEILIGSYLAKTRYIVVNQYDLQGKFIKKWNSIKQASEELKGKQQKVNKKKKKKKKKMIDKYDELYDEMSD